MSEAAEKLKAALLALPPDVRLEVADFLYDSVPGAGATDEDEEELTQEEWQAAWAEELQRRMKSIVDGTAKGRPGDVVMRELKERFG